MNDEMSKLIRISLEKAQQQAGVSSPILERSTVIKPYVDNNWIYCLHKLLMEGSMTIKLENTEESETTRVGDVYLMEKWADTFEIQDLKKLNSCRLYLQVTTMADICDVKGTYILKNAWGVKFPVRKNNKKWPIQKRPPKSSILLWQQALLKLTKKWIRLNS